MRGDVVSLRGTARAFAKLTVREDDRIGPVHVPWKPRPAFWKGRKPTAGDGQSD
jgi:signal peptidase I